MNEAELKLFLKTLYKNLNILREREAKFGGDAPLELLNLISDHQTAIALVESRLANEITTEQLKEQLAPLNLSLDRAGTRLAVGRNFIQIGTLVIPAVPILLTAVSMLGLLGFVSYIALAPTPTPTPTTTPAPTTTPTPGPMKMKGFFNVAVAYFGEEDSAGHVQPSKKGQELSGYIFDGLMKEFDILPVDLQVEYRPLIWHDSLGSETKGVTLDTILGDTAEARKEAAAKLALDIDADMVIYGNLKLVEGSASFTPEFYVAPLKDQADEIQGSQQLGAPIPIQPSLNLDDRDAMRILNRKLALRTEALSRFTFGLMYDLRGASRDALDVFQKMEKELDDWAEEDEGKEILYYFIGRELFFLSRNEAEAAKIDKTIPELIEAAENYFQLALKSKPDYARARIGLASTYYQQAYFQPAEDRLSKPNLAKAIETYQQALADASDDPLTASKARLGLGVAYHLKGVAYYQRGDADEDADYLFNLAIQEVESALSMLIKTKQFRLLGQAYLTLGVAYAQQAEIRRESDPAESIALLEQALEAYDHCIAQKDEAFDHRILTEEIIAGACQPNRQKAEEALKTLRGG